MQNILLLIALTGLIVYAGYRHYKGTRARALPRQRQR